MLHELEAELRKQFHSTSLRGSGTGQFIYLQVGCRAIEASVDNTSLWVEFWDDAEEAPAFENTFQDAGDAFEAIVTWLK